uniref:RRM domain-containing protein n=1 Tax=Ditylenchus dipsaci TaxID=166011 RepID=A0A915CPZ4_9BILA
MDSVVPMPLLQQYGKVFVGPGAKKEAEVIGLGLSELSSRQRDDLERAKKYALEQSIKHVRTKQQIAHQQNQQKVAMYAQALSLMARVYVGSVSFEVREEQIKQHFAVFGPIKTINMSFDTGTGHHKGFAFLEYEVPEAALLAQEAMNGKFVGGRNLKVLPVGRPANMPQAQPIIDMVMQDAKEYNRVYVASVHPDVSEQDLKSIFEAFGEVVRCQLAKEGFGYLEFKTKWPGSSRWMLCYSSRCAQLVSSYSATPFGHSSSSRYYCSEDSVERRS